MDVAVAASTVKEAVQVALSYASEGERDLLTDVVSKLETSKFNLVVMGQFKRGKTTFVNALLGEKLLPSAVLPLTSIVTLIDYGESKKVEVHFLDGACKEISIKDIFLYVTEKENPENKKGVKFVKVYHPADILKHGIVLVDTPGVGSVYENNTDVTYGFLPRVDAAVFLLTVDPPLSREEIDFLRDVMPHVERLFFVLNKVDYVAKDELGDVVRFITDNLENIMGVRGISVYPISARMALEGRIEGDKDKVESSGILELERDLRQFLLQERAMLVVRSSAKKVLSILSSHLFKVDLELKAADTPVEELEMKINEFRSIKERVEQEIRDSEFLFRGEIESLIKLVNMDVEQFRKVKVTDIFAKLMDLFERSKHKSNLELSKILDDAMKELLVNELDRFVAEENEKVNQEYARIAKRFSERVNSIIDRLMQLAADLFEIKLERFEVEEEISKDSSLWYRLEDPPRLLDIAGGVGRMLSYTFLPSSIVHRKIRSELSKKLPEKVDMNCGRVRSDFVDRINKSAMELRWGMREKFKETVEFIGEAVSKAMEVKHKTAGDVKTFKEDLLKRKKELDTIVSRLKSILNSEV